MMPKIVRNVTSLRRETARWKTEGLSYAIVPTMGALHEGHLDLVREAFKRADRVVVSIFVNPKQFGAKEDLSRYPRDEEGDVEKLNLEGVPLIYAPTPDSIYPLDFSTTIHVEGPAKVGLEDKYRPLFFDGVATVVSKLFIQSVWNFILIPKLQESQL